MSATTKEAPAGAEQIVHLVLADLVESPFNPRKHFGEQGLDELATDIAAQKRILQPLLVRPIVPPMFRPQYEAGDTSVVTGYELVFGHRRRRAGMMAELKTGPCMVRDMTDEEVKRAQISENLQREDVHPIEEAEGFQALMRDHGLTADDVAEQIGGASRRSYVYSRLRLLKACPEVRQACLRGDFGADVALLVARVGNEKMQAKALGYIKGKYLSLEDGGKQSVRRIQSLLNERFMLNIKDAIFDPEDATLSSAGRCSSCPKRSGNAPEFVDVVETKKDHWSPHSGANVCTDPDCFAQKKTLHLVRKANELLSKGKEVIGGNRARALIGADGKVKGGYVPWSTVPAELKGTAASTLLGKPLGVVTIQDPRTGKTVEAVKLEEAKAAAKKLGVQPPKEEPSRGGPPTIADRMRQEAEAKRNAERLTNENAKRRALLDQVRAAVAAAPRSTWDMRLITDTLVNSVGYGSETELLCELHGVKDKEQLRGRMDVMTADDLGRLMLDCLLIDNVRVREVYWLDRKPKVLQAAAQHYGVAASTPSTAGASTKSGADRGPRASAPSKAAPGKKKAGTTPSLAIADAPDDRGLFDENLDGDEASGIESSPTTPAVAGEDAQIGRA